MEIYAKAPDPDMDYFNDFLFLWESVESELDCIFVQFNGETKRWERM